MPPPRICATPWRLVSTLLLLSVSVEVVVAFCPSSTTTTSSTTTLFGKRMKFQPPPRKVSSTEYIQCQEEDVWKTMDTVDILEKGGVGIMPTSAGYGLITPLSSKAGLERICGILQQQQQQSSSSTTIVFHLLCSNLASIDEHCYGIDKTAFKMLKKSLPGLFSFVLLAKTTVPKSILHPKKKSIHVRIPCDPILRYLQDDLLHGMPLLFAPLITNDADDSYDGVDPDAAWYNLVDFVVDAGLRPSGDADTVYDLTQRDNAILVREGLGKLELVL